MVSGIFSYTIIATISGHINVGRLYSYGHDYFFEILLGTQNPYIQKNPFSLNYFARRQKRKKLVLKGNYYEELHSGRLDPT